MPGGVGGDLAGEFCRREEGATPALLNPEVFADVLEVQTPYTRMYYCPGQTEVRPGDLWGVLGRAAERKLRVSVVTVDPNGLGTEDLLTIGVVLSRSGRWLEPEVLPRDLPLDGDG